MDHDFLEYDVPWNTVHRAEEQANNKLTKLVAQVHHQLRPDNSSASTELVIMDDKQVTHLSLILAC